MEFNEQRLEGTITLQQLWALFTRIKLVPYGSSVEIRFTVDTEMLYNSYQKELYAHSQLGMN